MQSYRASSSEEGVKLQIFLNSKMGKTHSVRHIKRLIDRNHCRINGRIERFGSTPVRAGDLVSLVLEKPIEKPKVIFEDEWLLAIDKPAGVVSEQLPFQKAIHRLDRDTSGLLLFAKQDPEPLKKLFVNRQVKKTYLAIVDGVPSVGEVENYLGRRGGYAGQTIWGAVHPEKGKWAKTSWNVLRHGSNWAYLRCYPETGRTHQIRVHFASQGHPILGDGQYGKRFRCSYLATRHLLHAETLSFTHPHTGDTLELNASIPSDFQEVLDALSDR